MASLFSLKKNGDETRDTISSFVTQVFSWSIGDIFNHDLYKNKVNKIPETFFSVEQYLNSFRYPLLEETRADLSSSMKSLYQAPKCKILSVEKHKDYKPPKNFVYKILLTDTGIDNISKKEAYKPQASDLIAFSDVRPENVKDFTGMSYTPAMILNVDGDTSKPCSVEVLSSKRITTVGPLFAVYLINMTTNLRIWRALSGEKNGDIIQKVLRENSQIGNDCGLCSHQEAEMMLRNGLDSFNLNESQLHAVLRSIATSSCGHKNSVKLIWGPPGTGKTKTIGVLLSALLNLKCKTLTCAPTNTAVVEVTTRLMSIIKQTLESSNYGLGDIVLFGNAERMKINDNGDLHEVFFDYRCKILWRCFAPHSGWGYQVKSMILLLEEPYQQYLLYLENAKESAESINNQEVVIKDFSEFLRGRFTDIEKEMRFSIVSICSHMPTSFVSVTLVKKMYTARNMLKDFRSSLKASSFSELELKKIFSEYGMIGFPDTSTSALLSLKKIRTECLEVLRSLEEFTFPSFPDEGSIRDFCLENACLICCTASSSANLSAVKNLKLVVVDEAAQLKALREKQ